MKANIKSISELTGFSPATISNALNFKKGVRKETADKIIKTAKSLGYIVDSEINKIKIIIYRKQGSVIDDNPFFSLLTAGAEEVCKREGFELSVVYLDMRNSHYHEDLKRVVEDPSTGSILLGSELEEEELVYFKSAKGPVVLADYWTDEMNMECIVNNGANSVEYAAEYLIKKGHKRIGYLRGELRVFPFREREDALTTTLNRHGLPLQDKYVFTVPTSMNQSYVGMKAHLQKSPELPTAFFADNDVMALGCMRAMKEFGIRLPQDVSIIGYDDIPLTEITSPKLTTIHTQTSEIGRAAAEKIVESAKNPNRPKSKIIYATSFKERDSVRDITGEE